MKNLKNWWLQIAAVILTVLELGFDAINPIFDLIGIPDSWFGYIKAAFLLYSLVKSKLSLPTQNADKLQDMVQSIGGTQTPPNKDEK